MNTGLLSELEVARLRQPGLPDADLVRELVEKTLDDLSQQPPISPEVVASYRGIARIEVVPLGWAGSLTHEHNEVVARVRMSDTAHRRRFTAFHEILHTFLPGYGLAQYRCDPPPPLMRRDVQREDVESLADLGASELLLPRRFVGPDVDAEQLDMDLVESLADRYQASLEATGLRVVQLAKTESMLIRLEPDVKPSQPDAEPVLRVKWASPRGSWPFVPRWKSVLDESPFGRALNGEVVSERTDVVGLTSEPIGNVHVSARLYPYSEAGVQKLRVLALLTRASRAFDAA